MPTTAIKPTSKAIESYYATLQSFGDLHVSHETGLRAAFQRLLEDTAKTHDWLLVAEVGQKVQGKTIRPDATLYKNAVPRGYWEAKDSADDLDAEIRKKIGRGYPLNNIIFEDTRQAVLYQNKQEAYRADLSDPGNLAHLLNTFYTYTEPVLDNFDQALDHFKGRVPELAHGLVTIIEAAHKDDPFKSAFAAFYELCKTALNPNIRVEAVDEMLVQHLLTERLIRRIFDNSEFIHRNVIAAEVEKVIGALVSHSFNRDEFLKSLDTFYQAIEQAAHGLDFTQKQHLLNMVYERFFQGYSVKVADTHGIVYTPQPIVDFMCASVAEVLQTEFGKSLGDEGVNILDPATGTGNFIVNLLRRIDRRDLPRAYRNQLFANEIMLLPYYIAALNVEHAYYELTGQYEPFEGLCFVDTLDSSGSQQLSYFTPINTKRIERQKNTPITVIVGNPPYNAHQIDENDNNKNRKYKIIDKRIKDTFAKDSTATNKNALSDMYVKFFRWAIDRLGNRPGIVCYVTNNSFVDQIAFDGMRKHLLEFFTHIYHVDLHGNVRQNPKLSGTTHNVFGIQVGVGITIAVRVARSTEHRLYHSYVPQSWRKEEKLDWLGQRKNINGIEWETLVPDKRNTWLVPEHADAFAAFLSIGSRSTKAGEGLDSSTIFKTYGRGVATSRDDVAYDFECNTLKERVQRVVDEYNGEVDRYKRAQNGRNIDEFVRYDKIAWSRDLKLDLQRGKYAKYENTKIRSSLYRPFCKRYLFFDRVLNEEVYVFPKIFPSPTTETENRIIALTDLGSEKPFMTLIANTIADLHVVGAGSSAQCFPFYDEDGSNRRENITDWALTQFRAHYADSAITKWDIFYYTYGLLHHPDYRTRFADNLKRDLPRIPFAPDFRAFASAGHTLADLHLTYEQVKPYPLKEIDTPGVAPLADRCKVVDKMRLSKDKTALAVNPSLTLSGIPPETFNYRLGNRSALEWVIDQYQVKRDERSGITSDPNRPDDPEYIVRLVGQVVQVSLETVKLVAGLPAAFA